jgi:hypothetical protein
MATKPASAAQGTPRAGTHGYERRDVNVVWIFGLVALLALSFLVMHFLLNWLLNFFTNSPAPGDAFRRAQTAPPSMAQSFPRLQVSPRVDLRQLQAWEDAQLTNYGWINQTAGIVHIPIERAMELVLQKGLPVQTNSQAQQGISPQELIQRRSVQPAGETQGNK